jgi:hypothetical protein
MAFMPIEPARMVGMSSMAIIGTSNETSTATCRKAPIKANLLFDDQAAMMMESVPIAPAAMTYRAPTFKSTPRMTGASGMIAHNNSTDMSERIGARL